MSDPDEGLRRWLLTLENYLSAFSGLPDPLIRAIASHDSPLAVPCRKLTAVTDEFAAAAQRHGTARPTVRARGLFLAAVFLARADNTPIGDNDLPTLRQLLETGYSTR
ncbi:SbtR family transcriptional regulator [Streptomyces prasinus]